MRFSAAALTSITTATANTPVLAFRVPAGLRGRVREIGITVNSATSAKVGLVRATTVSVTPGTSVAGQNMDGPGMPASTSLLVTTFGTAPVIAAVYLQTATINGSLGGGVIWPFPPDDLLIAADGTNIGELVLCNLEAITFPALRVYFRWED